MSALEPARPPESSATGRSRLPISQGLAFRVAVIGGVALVMFAIIFFRLWYLQVLSGEQYVAQANTTYYRTVSIPAPRGQILDREGKPLVVSRATNAVLIDPAKLPPVGARREALYRRLGHLIGMHPQEIQELVSKGHRETPYADVTIKTNAGRGVLTELGERKDDYPGVTQEPTSVRSYPYGDLAAQVLGYTGKIDEAELKKPGFRGVEPNATVGQSGLEYYYDRYLRGVPGTQKIQVDAAGDREPQAREHPPIPPKAGYNLRTTLDLGLQQETERALAETIGGGVGDGGAAVALDPENGEVLALASYPSFDPNAFERELTDRQYDALAGKCSGCQSHLIDRATESLYPTGSTFKPIAAMGALEAGVITTDTTMGGGECVAVGNECRHNASEAELGNNDVTGAIKLSEDTFFYLVGVRANNGLSIQDMARKLGIGVPTGIELSESEGLVPDAATVQKLDREQRACEHELHDGKRPKSEPCEIAEPDGVWTVGDNANLAVGQGELQTTPLQMAVAYSALANAYVGDGHGRVVTPHLGKDIEEPQGGLLEALTFKSRPVNLDYSDLQAVMTGLHEATSEEGGTSADVWSGWNQSALPVYGKTGTAERVGQNEQAWYMCYVGSPTHPIVIAVTIEEGGYGDAAAAPIARLMAEQYYHQPLKLVTGSNTDQ